MFRSGCSWRSESLRSGRTAFELKAIWIRCRRAYPERLIADGNSFATVTEEQLKKSRRPSATALLGGGGAGAQPVRGLVARMLEAQW